MTKIYTSRSYTTLSLLLSVAISACSSDTAPSGNSAGQESGGARNISGSSNNGGDDAGPSGAGAASRAGAENGGEGGSGDVPHEPACGDGTVDELEACEPSVEASRTCADISGAFDSGTATCEADCRWNVGDCKTAAAVCGDGEVQGGETCEPTTFSELDCAAASPEFMTGTVKCSTGCSLDFSACKRAKATCGNSVTEGGEECDDGNSIDDDDCGNDCGVRVNGQPVLREGLPEHLVGGEAVLSPGSACANRETRDGYRDKEFADIQYQVVMCHNRTTGTDAFSEAAVEKLFAEVNDELRESAHIRLFRHSVRTFEDDDCIVNYDDDEAGKEARGTPAQVVPIIFVSRITTKSRLFGIGGYASEGGHLVLPTIGTGTTLHELGHFFGLEHTFACGHGSETTKDCATTGDMFCDTPADRGPRGVLGLDTCSGGARLDGSCDTSGCGIGSCDDGAMPDRDNFMSYYHCSPGEFSAEQADYMRCQLNAGVLQRFNWRTTFTPSEEVCNNRDDDGDGKVDEGVTRSCGTSGGACAMGVQECVSGNWSAECKGEKAPTPEICDGKDNDCNGKIDDGVDPIREGADAVCPNKGVCAGGAAKTSCKGGEWTCTLPNTYMADECKVINSACGAGSLNDNSCNDHLDNDCDGVVDEHSLYPECAKLPDFYKVQQGLNCHSSPNGRCGQNGGNYKCVQLAESCGVGIDCVGATFPEAERCDGQDWDCNGKADDRGDQDGDGYGTCENKNDCSERADIGSSIYPGAAEQCNASGIDFNCNGVVNDGFACSPGGTRNCDVCGWQTGLQYCNGSCSFDGSCHVGNTLPNVEVVYQGNDPALHHGFGGWCNEGWCAGGSNQGYHTYGPYLPLGAASYRVQFAGTFSDAALAFDVYDASTGATLAVTDTLHAGWGSISYGPELAFTIPKENACHQIEFRMWASTSWVGGASLHTITLTRDTQYQQ